MGPLWINHYQLGPCVTDAHDPCHLQTRLILSSRDSVEVHHAKVRQINNSSSITGESNLLEELTQIAAVLGKKCVITSKCMEDMK